ncbi:hypothetical protein ID866_4042 [Astraeus odoratus]|nr:hypothetical protein ID866_4042 [Astraeus odoratus]
MLPRCRTAARLLGCCERTKSLRGLTTKPTIETDAYGIPVKPTWSVKDLLSSYPSPSISPGTFHRLHELSALIPPAQGTPEHDKLRAELEELIRLVEAVKLTKLEAKTDDAIPDRRIWAEERGIHLSMDVADVQDNKPQAGDLLALASRTVDGMYVVETDRS